MSSKVNNEKENTKMLQKFTIEQLNDYDADIANEENERLRWSNYVEYTLSVVGFVIDLGNVWRFPTVCFQNGGGAFLLPYFICLFIIGMPCMYLELALGQYFQIGNITIWSNISPLLKGIGYSVIFINILMLSYYMTLQAYALYYLVFSFRSQVPWSTCGNTWNTFKCIEHSVLFENSTNQTSSTLEFFNNQLLGLNYSNDFDVLGGLKWDLVLAVISIFFFTTLCLLYGIKSSGKAIYVTALLPYVCLIVLLVQSLTLKGSTTGILYYLTPNFEMLFKIEVWSAAATQIFFSLGPGFGVLITYASYSPKTINIQKMTIFCSIVNCVTSFLYGIVVFAGIGYLANKLNVEINHFKESVDHPGPGLVYIIYPEILATFKASPIFSIVFFVMLITLGIDSAFGGLEGLFTAISDEFSIAKKHPFILRTLFTIFPFLTCLPSVTYGGIYVVHWLDSFSVFPSVLVIVLLESIIVSWYYGVDKFCGNIKQMNRKIYLEKYWKISWKYVVPSCLTIIVILTILSAGDLVYGMYEYPKWSSIFGWVLNAIVLSPIPLYALFKSLKNRYEQNAMPISC
jgi:SNF family Na+-dependent transporter